MNNPRAEAAIRLGGGIEVRVLEPSPPPVVDPPWFADDPVDGGEVVPLERPGSRSWVAACLERGDTALVSFCVERWLGPWRRLEALPASFAATRLSLHAVAEHVLQPVRKAATGKIGLRWTRGGFGTPFLPGDRQLRIDRGALVDGDRRSDLTSLAAAGRFVGVRVEEERDLEVTVEGAAALGDWFGFCTSVLEQVRADTAATDEAGRVQIWPEHFDAAVDLAGLRCNLGGSPGDAEHPQPYLYVGPWEARSGPFWNEPFGASLPYPALLASPDQRRSALGFFREGLARLSA